MIQRQQTLWLILATGCAVLTFMLPFATGEEPVTATSMRRLVELNAGSNLFLLLLTIATVCLSAVAIFYFKDRKMQKRLCLIGLIIAIGLLVLYIVEMQKLVSTTLALWSLLSLVVIGAYIMAYRGIVHDDRLVKSLDKFR